MNKYYSLEKICYKIIYRVIKPFLRRLYLKICTPYIKFKDRLFHDNYRKFNETDGDVDINKYDKICIFSHFDHEHKIADYVVFYLQSLQELGCAIIFVSTCSKLEQKSIDKITPLVAKIVTRKNIGWDFGSFHIGYMIAKKYNHHELMIFANDSVYGPLQPLQNLIDLMNNCDVGGVTDSFECGYHIQSYFLMFSKQVFLSPVFNDFFKNFIFSNNKTFVVHNYEIGLSRILLKNGFKLKVLCDYSEVANKSLSSNKNAEVNKSMVEFCNPTYHFWDILIEDFKYPFIKRLLLSKNPDSVANLSSWIEVIKKTGYNVNLIKEHLKRISTGILKI